MTPETGWPDQPPTVVGSLRNSARTTERIAPHIAAASDHFACSVLPRSIGAATAAKIPTIKITTISSTSVKPLLFLFFTLFNFLKPCNKQCFSRALFGRVQTNYNLSLMRAKVAMAATAIATISSIEPTAPTSSFGRFTSQKRSSGSKTATAKTGRTTVKPTLFVCRQFYLPAPAPKRIREILKDYRPSR